MFQLMEIINPQPTMWYTYENDILTIRNCEVVHIEPRITQYFVLNGQQACGNLIVANSRQDTDIVLDMFYAEGTIYTITGYTFASDPYNPLRTEMIVYLVDEEN